jgi:hypothetical protein
MVTCLESVAGGTRFRVYGNGQQQVKMKSKHAEGGIPEDGAIDPLGCHDGDFAQGERKYTPTMRKMIC